MKLFLISNNNDRNKFVNRLTAEFDQKQRTRAADPPVDFGAGDFVLDTRPCGDGEKTSVEDQLTEDSVVNQLPDFVPPTLKRVIGDDGDSAASAEAKQPEPPQPPTAGSAMAKFKRRNMASIAPEDDE